MKIVIFNTQSTESELEKLILFLDNTFESIGSDGYKVKKEPDKQNGFTVFKFTECDIVPRRNLIVGLKENKIWASKVASTIFKALCEALIEFSVSYTQNPPFTLPQKSS
ncbi:MAG: hypothetical protein Athens071426_641 [Parcubacteria group bacterium Athens0714_26]|nr:MAG: hypothetical protein Athens101426_512 [Parcubacteria group bacterium Athens1014_26]TSD01822.1 MAG: hypothetical protein Athens071426_641 [Parcubacteria group bacterium Athens0714_26]